MPSRRRQSIVAVMIFMLNVITADAQTCHRAEYRVGQECCPMCPPGNRVNKHCTEFTSTSCEPCADGTFLDQLNGQTECFPCKTCDADPGLKVKRPCTTTSDAVCGPQDGFFCVDRRGDGCVAAQKHRSCKAGQYISRRGTAITDTECSDCTGETYSNGTFPSCQPHTKCESEGLQQIRPGNHAADSECGPKHDSSNKTVIIVPVILVAVIIVAVAVAAAVMCRRNKRPKQSAGGREKVPEQETLRGGDPSEACVLAVSGSGENGNHQPSSIQRLPLSEGLNT
ncbi:tumor necrosis factor receptor superfamily member 14-like isoform X1 [Myripristis murdjan]|uniref:tumor necrosis factor receptor superfamily member 14-like isoform X1 n=1 Tax=Myripristis murdjan TaxID=586833 RepID=UPI001175D1F6|nr:tumor necrosis factor receptor superfamily member 14-like isoform X1 [Myripristis murdjan]XP_029911781.1 tumor necrosis factor receptor superfamily member 14-like isoform X1 [Myripristis murdjan]XP_029911783.1 tumor necrosis factor receptor superfamily member 14-like isoform X1 [Myripristis murdjan]XP_029911784.1 tumor necrosis factor receptor superfamily member 14-like isoform X1 [Myripristis murdjan]XP_029911785.1 tumor necrosis factor receptor superfamily member 14-like isoform X1 [Myripr